MSIPYRIEWGQCGGTVRLEVRSLVKRLLGKLRETQISLIAAGLEMRWDVIRWREKGKMTNLELWKDSKGSS